GETEVVLDPGALPCLTAGCSSLDDHDPQALGSRIDGGAQASRTTADDHHVIELVLRVGAQADRICHLDQTRLYQRLTITGDHHRCLTLLRTSGGEQASTVRIIDVVPAVGHHVAGE